MHDFFVSHYYSNLYSFGFEVTSFLIHTSILYSQHTLLLYSGDLNNQVLDFWYLEIKHSDCQIVCTHSQILANACEVILILQHTVQYVK